MFLKGGVDTPMDTIIINWNKYKSNDLSKL